jgi:hypothetical protein
MALVLPARISSNKMYGRGMHPAATGGIEKTMSGRDNDLWANERPGALASALRTHDHIHSPDGGEGAGFLGARRKLRGLANPEPDG